MERYAYPHRIENGAGECLIFLRKRPGARGDRLEVENIVKSGSGPPMHVHLFQEEALTVTHGRIAYQRPGEPPQFAGPGETVTFKPGEAHKFWNPGQVDLRCTGYIEPADNVEYFLTEIYASTKQRGGAQPDPFDAAFLARRYRDEFSMVEIPALVQQFVFPIQVAVGRLLGKYRKYADAPEPVRR
jgi:mannose-6-phosphate isomerase-like protein (cupin superfamily)